MGWFSKVGLGVSAVSLLAFATACGNTGNSASNGNGSSSESGSILIGVETPTTGSSAKMGTDMNNGVKMAAAKINAAGGVLGKKIKLVYGDSACDPQSATAAANKLVSENVVAVVGGYCSGAALPATGVFHQSGIPWVLTAADSQKLPDEGYNDIFLIQSTAVAQAQTAADYMVKQKGAKRVAIINDGSAYSVDLATRTQKDVQADGGQVVAFDKVNPQETDFSAELTKLKTLKPDVTYWTGYYNAGGLLLKQFKQLGVPGLFGVGDGSNDLTMVKIAGKQNAEGMFTTTTLTPQFEPSAKGWIQQYQSKYNMAPGPYSASSYDGLRLIADAIKRANSTKPADIIKALASTNNFSTFAGPVSFKSDGELKTSNYVVLITKSGQYTMGYNPGNAS